MFQLELLDGKVIPCLNLIREPIDEDDFGSVTQEKINEKDLFLFKRPSQAAFFQQRLFSTSTYLKNDDRHDIETCGRLYPPLLLETLDYCLGDPGQI